MCWEAARANSLLRLKSDLERGLVDDEIIELLLAINENENMFSTSSCAGRITIGCNGKGPEDKASTEHLLTSHTPISVYDVMKALEEKNCSWLWLKASHPLLDLYVRDFDLALKLVSIARSAGFKYSGIQPSSCCYRVIIRGSDNVQYPLSGRENGYTIAKVVSHANKFLLNGKLKLARFVGALEGEGIISSDEAMLFHDDELL
jgi:tRNA wybutosine-synthesizing protein 3